MVSSISRSGSYDGSYSAVSGNGPNNPTDESCCQKCQDWVTSFFKAIGQFFVHSYANLHMFGRSWSSMGGNTDNQEIQRRIGEIDTFALVLRNPRSSTAQVVNRFNALSMRSRDLFYYTSDYMGQLRSSEPRPGPMFPMSAEPPPSTRSLEIRAEISREVEQVISLQRTMTAVNTFYRVFTGRFSGPWRLPPDDDDADNGGSTSVDSPGGVTRPNNSPHQNRDIPGTVAYTRDAIPADVQQKANEIARLKANYDAMANAPAAPAYFSDPVGMEIMVMPVFDASHPAVQQGLPALRAALNAGSSVGDSYTIRHHLDRDTMEQLFRSRPRCPTCRHPHNNRANLRIDTGLQDEILAFLRRVAPGG